MSFDTLAWAAKQKCERPADKLVLIGLASCAGADHCAYPSVAWLCEFSALDRKTVIAALDRLTAAGLIADTFARVGTTKQVKVYELPVEREPETEQFQKRNSSGFSSKQSQKRDTELVRNQSPQKATPSSVARAPHGSRLPDDWEPGALPEDLQSAVTAWRPGTLERELSKFRDYWRAKPGAGGRKADWQATWRNWIRKAVENGEQHRQGGTNGRWQRPALVSDLVAAHRERLAVVG